MTDGRTIWFPLDTGWWRREHVVELGEEFGPVGPAVLLWLSCEAKLQNDGGRVKAGPRTVARGVFSDPVTVGHVLSRAVRIGALHDYEEHDGRFVCRISGWERDNKRGSVSLRKARSRAKNAPDVTVGHGESRPVTEVPQREEKRTDEADASSRPEIDGLCSLLADLVEANGSKRPNVTKAWLDACRLLLDKDGRDPAEAERLIRWCQASEFWRSNIMGMPKFREKYDTLRLQADRPAGQREQPDYTKRRNQALRDLMAGEEAA